MADGVVTPHGGSSPVSTVHLGGAWTSRARLDSSRSKGPWGFAYLCLWQVRRVDRAGPRGLGLGWALGRLLLT